MIVFFQPTVDSEGSYRVMSWWLELVKPPDAVSLVGDQATWRSLRPLLSECDILVYAGHGSPDGLAALGQREKPVIVKGVNDHLLKGWVYFLSCHVGREGGLAWGLPPRADVVAYTGRILWAKTEGVPNESDPRLKPFTEFFTESIRAFLSGGPPAAVEAAQRAFDRIKPRLQASRLGPQVLRVLEQDLVMMRAYTGRRYSWWK